MKRIFALTLLALAAIVPAHAQGTCSATAPCVAVTINSPSAAATVTSGQNAAGATIELAGPESVQLYKCVGSAAGCGTVAAPGPNGWTLVAGSPLMQTALTLVYNDPEALGALVNYQAQGTFTGSLGGVPSAWSAIFQISVALPTAQTAPGTPGLSGAIISSGTSGPQ